MTVDNDILSDETTRKAGFVAALELLFAWRRFIIINVLVVAVIALAVSLIIPKKYKATASVLPPRQQDLFSLGGIAGSLAKGLPGASRLGLGSKPSSYNYFAILNSRTALEQIVRQFDLVSVYDVSDSSMEKAIRRLTDNVAFEEQDDDNINIEVRDEDPARAAAMANAFVDILNQMSVRLGKMEAGDNRAFLESRLQKTEKDLREAEDKLKAYEEKSKIIISPEERSSVSGFAALYALRAKKEVDLAVMSHSVVEDNPTVQSLKLEITELDRKLGTLPEIGVESIRRYRDVMIQEKILEFLVPMYEQAKIDEVKDLPVVLVLDRAVPPERKISPQRALIVLVSTVLSFFIFVPAVFLFHGLTSGTALGPLTAGAQTLSSKVVRWYRISRP